MTQRKIYELKPKGAFAVERLGTRHLDESPKYVQALRRILRESWSAKFVPKQLKAEDLERKLATNAEQREGILNPIRQAAYWLAYRAPMSDSWEGEYDFGLRHVRDAFAFLRVETYKPRTPFKKPYPNITDIETLNGKLKGPYEKHVAALIHLALGDFEPERKIAHYGEAPNADGIAFMERLGFEQKDNRPTEEIGDSTMTYVHLEAPRVDLVDGRLKVYYRWLDSDIAA